MTSIDEVKARTDIVDVVSETVELRRSGKNYTGFCPFHSNTRTPAFVVFPDTGTWRCFGQCNEGGDVFSYVMKKEGWDFSEALQQLAEKAGIELSPPTPEARAQAEEYDNLRELLEEGANFFQHQLLNTPAGQVALEYLQGRDLRIETIEAFGLGYAPHSWDALSNYFREKGTPVQDLINAGLVSSRDDVDVMSTQDVYDRFRNRVIFPIRDDRGRMAGFGARILDPNDVPKFLNSPQTVIFDKGRLLYGLDRARKAIRNQDQAVIVEGYLDVIALHQAGYETAVSPMGTALTDRQFQMIKRYSRNIVLALDPDAAGDKATLRGLEIARESLDHETDPVFDARGLLGYESRLRADIRVTTLPTGKDPDDVVNEDPHTWEKILTDAKPIVMHVMDTLSANRDIGDPKVKVEIANQVLPLIQDVPNSIERDTFRQRLARLLQVDERALMIDSRAQARDVRPKRRTGRTGIGQISPEVLSASGKNVHSLEAHILGVLLRKPEMVYQVDRRLQEEGLPRLAGDDFQHAAHRSILQIVRDSIDQHQSEPRDFTLNSLSLSMMETADDLLARTDTVEPREGRVLGDLMRALLDLRLRIVRQEIDHLRFLMETAQEQGDLKATQYQQSMVQHIQIMSRLNQAMGHYTSRMAST
jgi:DNA primase